MGAKKFIVIVDDDPAIVMTMSAVLEAAGFETAGANDHDGAIRLISERRPDIVLCDMMMEAIDTGARLIKEIRKIYPGLTVILISSITDAIDSRYDYTGQGFDGFLKKPIDPELLVKTVRDAIDPDEGRF